MNTADRSWPRAIVHLDMDAFYVNVHCLDHPEHYGIPLAVGGRPNSRGVVASASYEARGFGVKSAMPMARAVRLCPQLTIVPADWSRIKECSLEVMEILEQFGPLERMSVDEAYLDLTGAPDPVAVARRIRDEVRDTTHLPVSVGLSTNKLVAKVASDFDKPNGFTVVPPGREADFLAPMQVRALHGVGPRTEDRLHKLGYRTCAQLARAEPAELRRRLGSHGAVLPLRARGIDPRPVEWEPGPPKSVSSERTFARDLTRVEDIRKAFTELAESVARSLVRKELVARTVAMKCRDSDFETITRQRTLPHPTDSADELFAVAFSLWEQNWFPGRAVRLCGVGTSNLSEARERQLRLF